LLRKLGKRLAELLDEDQWAECELILFGLADELTLIKEEPDRLLEERDALESLLVSVKEYKAAAIVRKINSEPHH
jgi:hypothetical protein